MRRDPNAFDIAARMKAEARRDVTPPPRAVLYGRRSTGGQALAEEAQEAACRSWCEARGVAVLGTHFDTLSGGTMKRPALADALAELADAKPAGWRRAFGPHVALVVHKIDRLSRSTVDALAIEETAEKAGARIFYVDGDNAETDAADMQRLVGRFLSEVERINARARVRVAHSLLRDKGQTRGNAPLGRRVDSCPEGTPKAERPKVLKADEAEGAVLDLLYARCSPHGRPDGWKSATSYAVAAELNASPELYPPRGKQWYAPSIHRIMARLIRAGWPEMGEAEAAE